MKITDKNIDGILLELLAYLLMSHNLLHIKADLVSIRNWTNFCEDNKISLHWYEEDNSLYVLLGDDEHSIEKVKAYKDSLDKMISKNTLPL